MLSPALRRTMMLLHYASSVASLPLCAVQADNGNDATDAGSALNGILIAMGYSYLHQSHRFILMAPILFAT